MFVQNWLSEGVIVELVGTIEDFIFQNDQNGYSIAVFETEDGVITTVVGYF